MAKPVAVINSQSQAGPTYITFDLTAAGVATAIGERLLADAAGATPGQQFTITVTIYEQQN